MKKARPIKKIQQEILRTLMILVSIMTILIAVISIIVNVKSESKRIDQNLENIAQAIARSQIVQEELSSDHTQESSSAMQPYLESLKESLTNIDVISVVDMDGIRRYHSNHELINSCLLYTSPSPRDCS